MRPCATSGSDDCAPPARSRGRARAAGRAAAARAASGTARTARPSTAASCAAQAPPANVIATAGTPIVAEDGQLERVPRRVEPEPDAKRERAEQQRRPAEAEREDDRAGRPPPGPHLRQPEPGVQRRQDEDQRKWVCCQNEQRDEPEREQRRRLPREQFVGADRPSRHEPVTSDDPADPGDGAEGDQRQHRPVAGERRGGVRRTGRPAGPGAEPAEAVEGEPEKEPEAEPAAQLPRSPACSRIRRRRQWANRSTTPTKNGIRSAASSSSIAQPRTTRLPAQTKLVVPCVSSRPWSSEPRSCCAVRPSAASFVPSSARGTVGERVRWPFTGGRQRHRRNAATRRTALARRRSAGTPGRALGRPGSSGAQERRSARAPAWQPSRRASSPESEACRRRSRCAAAPSRRSPSG